MCVRIIDETNTRYRGPLPKPPGLLPVPPEIAEQISSDQAAHQPNYTDDYAKLSATTGRCGTTTKARWSPAVAHPRAWRCWPSDQTRSAGSSMRLHLRRSRV